MECNLGNTVVSLPQSWDWLENRRGEDDKVSRRMWEVGEAEVRKTRVVKAKERRRKKGRRGETKRERKSEREEEEEEEIKKE